MDYLSKIASSENLHLAFRHIAANKGGPGVDGVSLETFEAGLEQNLAEISRHLLSETYQFQPVLGLEIQDGKRTVFLLTVTDRTVSQAISQVLGSPLDKYFHPASYAYRPGRSAVHAAEFLYKRLSEKKFASVLRCDIYKYFDHVDFGILFSFLDWALEGNKDKTLRLISRLLRQKRLVQGQLQEPECGLCQGSSLSPLLSNLYLTPLDRYLEKSGWIHVRFCDDLSVLLEGEEDAKPLCVKIQAFLEEYLKLKLHPDKLELASFANGFDFLGFHFSPAGRFPSKEAQDRLLKRMENTGSEDQERTVQQWEAYYGKGSASLKPEENSAEEKEASDAVPSYPIFNLIRSLFRGNPDCFARAYKTSNRYGYSPVKGELTDEEILGHLLGKQTLGIYLLRGDQAACTCLDLDIEKRIMDTCYHDDPAQFAVYADGVRQHARKIQSLLRELGFDPLLEESGYKGYHLWLFCEDFVPALWLITLWKQILRQVGQAPKGIQREIFPRESQALHSPGSLVKLPLGFHPGSDVRSIFLDDSGEAISNPQKLLEDVKKMSRAEIQNLIQEVAPISSENFSEVERLIRGCEVVKTLCQKAESEGNLGHFERMILLYTIGQLGTNGEKYLHEIIGHCYNYSPHFTQRQIEKKHPAPMGCRRIQEIMGDALDGIECHCAFKVPAGGYASPLLHVYPQATKDLGRKILRSEVLR